MKKGIFVLHEGISSTIFDSQVVEHVSYVNSRGINMEIYSFNTVRKHWKKSKSNLSKIEKLKVLLKKGVHVYTPFSHVVNFMLFFWFLYSERKKVSFFHARANYSAFIVGLFCKIFNIPYVWDCRGDSVAELKFALKNKFFLHKIYGTIFLLPIERFQINFLCKNANAAIFVSEKLYLLYSKSLKTKNFQIIPCLVNEDKFYYSELIRNDMRAKFQICDDDKVFIYSGSMVEYQGLSLQSEFFYRLFVNPNNKLFYLTTDSDKAMEFLSKYPSSQYTIKSVPFEVMNSYYNMADFAILLRETNDVNRVASPTKFGEYCMTGLQVVMNNGVEQAVEISNHLCNFVDFKNLNFVKTVSNRKLLAENSKYYYSRSNVFYKYEDIYKNIYFN